MPEDPWAIAALVSLTIALLACVAHSYFDVRAERSARRARDAAVREAYTKGRRDARATLRPVAEALNADDHAEAARRFRHAFNEIGEGEADE